MKSCLLLRFETLTFETPNQLFLDRFGGFPQNGLYKKLESWSEQLANINNQIYKVWREVTYRKWNYSDRPLKSNTHLSRTLGDFEIW